MTDQAIEPPKADLCSVYAWGEMVHKFDAIYPYGEYAVDFIRDVQRNAWMAGVHAAVDALKACKDRHGIFINEKQLLADLYALKMPKDQR